MTDTKHSAEREAFEAWVNKTSPCFLFDYDQFTKSYKGDDGSMVNDLWAAWQARAAIAATKSGSVEQVARAMAIHAGWDGWDSATHVGHTLSGNEPEDERQYWRELAAIAIAAAAPKAALTDEQTQFLAALNGGKGDLDAWLECNDEAECRAIIAPLVNGAAPNAALVAALQELAKDGEYGTATELVARAALAAAGVEVKP